jgi:hypothetical protein
MFDIYKIDMQYRMVVPNLVLAIARTVVRIAFAQVLNLVRPNFGAIAGEPFELFELNFTFRLMLFFY